MIALASSQQSISLGGVPGLHFDAVNRGDGTEAITIAHAYLGSGVYSAREISAATAAGQDPEHMADLIGVFVLSSKNGRLGAANSLNSNYSIDTTCLPLSLHLPQIDGVEAQINRRYIRFSLNTIHYVAVQASALMPNDDADAKMDKMIFYMLNAHGTVTRLSEAETDSIKSNRELAGAILSGLANKYANIHPPSHGGATAFRRRFLRVLLQPILTRRAIQESCSRLSNLAGPPSSFCPEQEELRAFISQVEKL